MMRRATSQVTAFALVLAGNTTPVRAQCNEQMLVPAASAAQDGFGGRVFVVGDVIVSGLPGHFGTSGAEGAVAVFERSGDRWSEFQFITAPNPGVNHAFGEELALGDEVLLIREVRQDTSLFPEGGSAVHVYERRAGQWTWSEKLEAPVPGLPNLLHYGNNFALEEPFAYIADNWRNKIWIYERGPTGWATVGEITIDDLHPLPVPDTFPRGIVVRDSRMLVGVETGGSFSVYLLERDQAGWQGVQPIGSPLQVEPSFCLEADSVFVGSEAENGQSGRVYVYKRQGLQWPLAQVLTPDPWLTLTRFGHRVAVHGDRLLVGAPAWDLPEINAGRAYLFLDDGTGWRQTHALESSQPIQNLMLGYDVDLSSDYAIAGATASSTGVGGQVYVYELLEIVGVEYGEVTVNSTGSAGHLRATGVPVIGANCLAFGGSGIPTGQFGYVLMAVSQNYVPLFGGSQGNLLLGLPIIRFSSDILTSDSNGEMSFEPDLTALPQATVFRPGETWNFQLWFRDVNPGPTSNTTNGLAVTFATTGDPAVQFPRTLRRELEETMQLVVTVTLSQPAGVDVSVPFSTGGTATYNGDWRVEEPNPFVIPAGETSFDMTLIVAEDAMQEGDETAIVTLGAPTGGVLGTAPEFTLTIEDDD